ncbi:BQ2448_4532 [Microbotryum intermedium]|uniref:BQ2448_4532 protein n=1 Tax=Microbotryum intermedium TaxID=269621 RepID=A0A238FKX8_9BASI|nr:BQ2448_4532 [Microbotryum intermedium]
MSAPPNKKARIVASPSSPSSSSSAATATASASIAAPAVASASSSTMAPEQPQQPSSSSYATRSRSKAAASPDIDLTLEKDETDDSGDAGGDGGDDADDDEDNEDEEPFEYESYDEEDEVVDTSGEAHAPSPSRSAHVQDDDEDIEDVDLGSDDETTTGHGPRPIIDSITLSDSAEEEYQMLTPPEPKAGSGSRTGAIDGKSAAPGRSSVAGGGKGKMSSRRQWQSDAQVLVEKYGAKDGDAITNFRKDEDVVQFTLAHAGTKLRFVIMFPELGGYPRSHQCVCYTENEVVEPEIEQVMSEIPTLPSQADRSVAGLMEYLVARIVHGRPSASAELSQTQHDTEDEDMDDYIDDDIFSNGAELGPRSAQQRALRKDFRELLAQGYRPGFTRVSELDNVVSVAKKVNELGVPVGALQAWDSELITGKVVYLVLLINFGSEYPIDPDNATHGQVQFRVGIAPTYKPSKASIATAFSMRGSSDTFAQGDMQAISLSAPLDSLFKEKFQEILLTRRQHAKCGWAAAERHCLADNSRVKAYDGKAGRAADKAEAELATSGSYNLPVDPMAKEGTNNYPWLAMAYLVRRFVMCPRFCLICFKEVNHKFAALKPFVCSSSLCLYQLISLGLGPSLEHEIRTNGPAVDLLIQLAYAAARDNSLKGEHQPTGIALQVPVTTHNPDGTSTTVYKDFDQLSDQEKCLGVAGLIFDLPSVVSRHAPSMGGVYDRALICLEERDIPQTEMKNWLEGEGMTDEDRMLRRVRKLTDLRSHMIHASCWRLLRWIVASNTSYLKAIDDGDELVQQIPKYYRQFRLVVGSPAKEHAFSESVKEAMANNTNAAKYPTLFAWHGSSVKNWHSILREGLHFRETINGRAFGHGVYFAKDGKISLGTYATAGSYTWKNAEYPIAKLAALCEIVNLPSSFVSFTPYFVVNQVDWIQCRYLVVERTAAPRISGSEVTDPEAVTTVGVHKRLLDPAHPITLGHKMIGIPDLMPKLEAISRRIEGKVEELNLSDVELLREPSSVVEVSTTSQPRSSRAATRKASATQVKTGNPHKGKESTNTTDAAAPTTTSTSAKPDDDPFEPADDARLELVRLLPSPKNPSRAAMSTIQKEMKAMLKVQKEKGPTAAGFYFDPERSNDNMFAWVIELMGFDPDLPISKDMKAKGVKSLLFEIRFGDTFPLSPPFFRLVHPRFLPFIHGGGGHVTGGGSICMDLLTSTGWSPIYQIEAILLQIRMAISNLEPRPARLDPHNWDKSYTIQEAVEGFKRAAATHNWTIPNDFAAITRAV